METSWIGKRVPFLMQTIILISVEFDWGDNRLLLLFEHPAIRQPQSNQKLLLNLIAKAWVID